MEEQLEFMAGEDDLAQEETDLDEDSAVEESPDTEGGEETVDVEDDTGEASEEDPTSREEKKTEEPTADYWKNEVEQLRKHNTDLNIALSQERSKRKEQKEEDANPLTRAQLLQIIKDNKGDEEVLLNVLDYRLDQAMKKGQQETVDSVKINQDKQLTQRFVNTAWPEMAVPTSKMRQSVDGLKKELMLEDHPHGDLAGVALLLMQNLGTLKQGFYDQGKKDGIAEKADGARKAGIKEGKVAPSGKKKATKSKSGLSGQLLDTAKQMGLSPGQQRIYARIKGQTAEAME